VADCVPQSRLQFGSLRKLLDALPPSPVPPSETFRINLRALRWIEALPLAVIAAFTKDHQERGGGGYIAIPPRYEFLQRMNLFKVIGVSLEERFRRHPEQGRFVPLQQVSARSGVPAIAQRILETLQIGDAEAAMVLRHCIGELVDNVEVHAQAALPAMVCAQHFPNARRTQVAIVDTGIGFRKTFESSPYAEYIRSDRDALKLGLAPYITSKPSSAYLYAPSYGRLGVGLFIVAETLAQVGGRLLICSGSAVHRVRSSGRRAWERARPWRGTIVGFEVPDTPLIPYGEAVARSRELARSLARAGQGA
jgi:hypothetical protein